jgi:heptose I phosphotransferase
MRVVSYEQIAEGFFADPAYKQTLRALGLTGMDAVFAFEGGQSLYKAGLTSYRSRLRIERPDGPALYLKRYTNTPKIIQIKNWLASGGRTAACDLDRLPGQALGAINIQTPKVVAYGAQWDGLFEKRSFILTEEIPGDSLEKHLPDCLTNSNPLEQTGQRRAFLAKLADWIGTFHRAGFCHRDLYLCHIFLTDKNDLVLIDLHRTFKPRLFGTRYRIKDLTQLYYSAPGQTISRADRLRFYLRYAGREKLTRSDRRLIRKIKRKAWRIADREIRRGRPVPFAQ